MKTALINAAGMEAENAHRQERGEAIAFTEEEFAGLAERLHQSVAEIALATDLDSVTFLRPLPGQGGDDA